MGTKPRSLPPLLPTLAGTNEIPVKASCSYFNRNYLLKLTTFCVDRHIKDEQFITFTSLYKITAIEVDGLTTKK